MTANSQIPAALQSRIAARLAALYGPEGAKEANERLLERLAQSGSGGTAPRWSERDVLLITYGDSITERGQVPLQTLRTFLETHVAGLISTVHLLPFYPFSSDDGFAVVNYDMVNPMLGDWDDVAAFTQRFDLMFDLVLNHVSSRSRWFKDFIGNVAPGRDYFHVVDEEHDLSKVVRPRVKPLLANFETEDGPKSVWATFSEDQIDLNFENPDVMLEMLGVLQRYLERGARWVRLDAVAFLWKQIGTSCIHLPETHEAVKLMRDVAEWLKPGCVILTETNVPHAENVSYFGAGDEAHVVYQFSLPPLLLHAMHTGNARYLTEWAAQLAPPPPGCTFLNFTASHDGVGLRPAEGLLPPEEIDLLVAGMQRAGGYASARDLGNGKRAVYELNITYFDALRGTSERNDDGLQVERFVASQLIAMSLQGVPALYIQSLVATHNDHERVDATGHFRGINRSKWALHDAEAAITTEGTKEQRVFVGISHGLSARRAQSAFHPEAPQRVLDLGGALFACLRGEGGEAPLLVLANVTSAAVQVGLDLPRLLPGEGTPRNLLAGDVEVEGLTTLLPYQVAWITRQPS